jgi:hypothetical protein
VCPGAQYWYVVFDETLCGFHDTKVCAASSVSEGQVRQLRVGIAANKKAVPDIRNGF